MMQVLMKALLAAGITASVVAAAAVGFFSLVPLPERRTLQPAPPEIEQPLCDPPPFVTD